MQMLNRSPPGLVQIQLNITNGIPLLILDIMSWPNNYKENREILSLVIIKKVFNGFGTKPNKMLSTAAFHLSGAVTISPLPLLFSVTGTGN